MTLSPSQDVSVLNASVLKAEDFRPKAIEIKSASGDELLRVEGGDLYLNGMIVEGDRAQEAAAQLATVLTGDTQRHLRGLPTDTLVNELNRRGAVAQKLPEESLLVSGYSEPMDLLDPDPHHPAFGITQIARRLAQEYRYANGTTYTVAQHSVLVASLCPQDHKLGGLLHDAPEAVIGDLPHPAKALCPGYRRVEAHLEQAVESRYGADLHAGPVQAADRTLYVTERASWLPTGEGIDVDASEEPAKDLLPIQIWDENEAYARFLECFGENADA